MSVICRRSVVVSFFAMALMAGPRVSGQDVEAGPPVPVTPNPNNLTQFVRLSLVEGDVRVSRGKKGEKATGAEWEKAEVDLPIEPGFSLVTGKGKAEIEFEDASTMYLGEDSAMSFGELSSKAGVTHSAVELISGAVTLNVYPAPGDWFKLRTPGQDQLLVSYPSHALTRVNRYLDATGLTSLENTKIMMGKSARETAPGKMVLIRDGQAAGMEMPRATFTEWDAWVTERVAARGALMAQVMGQSGLDKPLPGLADLEGQGNFFDCAPYGRCWEPTHGWAAPAAEAGPAQVAPAQSASAQTVSVGALAQQQAQQPVQASAKKPQVYPTTLVEDDYFPCGPRMFQSWWLTHPRTGLLYPVQYANPYPWQWAVCHAGSWIHHGRGYAWVAERRRHHHPPVHWVKVNGKAAFVPSHPRDEKGKAPINAKYGLFTVKTREPEKGGPVERLTYDPGTRVKVLASIPKEFDKPFFAPLKPVEAPRVEARLSGEAFLRPGFAGIRSSGTPITFDHKSQSFVASHQVMEGGKSVTVSQSLGGGPAATHGGGSIASHGGGIRRRRIFRRRRWWWRGCQPRWRRIFGRWGRWRWRQPRRRWWRVVEQWGRRRVWRRWRLQPSLELRGEVGELHEGGVVLDVEGAVLFGLGFDRYPLGVDLELCPGVAGGFAALVADDVDEGVAGSLVVGGFVGWGPVGDRGHAEALEDGDFPGLEAIQDERELAWVEVVDAELVDGFGSDFVGVGLADEREQGGGA